MSNSPCVFCWENLLRKMVFVRERVLFLNNNLLLLVQDPIQKNSAGCIRLHAIMHMSTNRKLYSDLVNKVLKCKVFVYYFIFKWCISFPQNCNIGLSVHQNCKNNITLSEFYITSFWNMWKSNPFTPKATCVTFCISYILHLNLQRFKQFKCLRVGLGYWPHRIGSIRHDSVVRS